MATYFTVCAWTAALGVYHRGMRILLLSLASVWTALRNLFVGLLRRRPDFVWLDVRGDLPEFEPRVGFLRRRFSGGEPPVSLEGLRARLSALAADGEVRGVVLRIRGLGAGWAALEEIRGELLEYRRGGGRVVAYLVECNTPTYYLASAADRVLAAPLATVDVTGLRSSVTFLKDALERVGVEAEVVAVSPYKSAFDRFTRTDFSRESREQVERLLDDRFGEFTSAVAAGRGMTVGEVERLVDSAPYPAKRAEEAGLVDGVLYEDELSAWFARELLPESGRERAKLAEWSAAKGSLRRERPRSAKKTVGVVSLSGAITRGKSRRLPLPVPILGGEQAGDESVVAALRAAEGNRQVGAVVFHVESGGGDALASDLIWREVERIRKEKPVVVLMGNVAASGGYYVGAAANHILLRRNTVTGSIGVITLRPNAAKLYEKLGLNSVSLTRGERAAMLDVSRPPTEDELRTIEEQLGSFYSEFKARVAAGRNLDESRLEGLAGGRVWSGASAVKLGLADEVGGFRRAVEVAAELAGIEDVRPGDAVLVRSPRKGRPAPGDPESLVRSALAGVVPGSPGELVEVLRELLVARTLAVMPFEIQDEA
ncbi:Peptidase family S49 [Rubrobacter radiotolerans]|uniref:Peptidase family S49 n=1 Tax=Rubrobacter radiotolerans TaxID=42256 RepID=A0A023X1X7_RUBRA|nr:Peptidase family S49 [Rubrobacter radiotolerans]SMC04683.1 protease-4 [Rubrobacter radiotolerans DSM 5868]